jgi:hypothetical protein
MELHRKSSACSKDLRKTCWDFFIPFPFIGNFIKGTGSTLHLKVSFWDILIGNNLLFYRCTDVFI